MDYGKYGRKISKFEIFPEIMPFCYEQTSPLGVATNYAMLAFEKFKSSPCFVASPFSAKVFWTFAEEEKQGSPWSFPDFKENETSEPLL